jgi:hypothetical protein
MPYGYLGQNTPNQTVSNSGVFSISDVADLEKQGKFGGSLELIEEQTASSDSVIDFLSIQENKYDVHCLQYSNFQVSIDNTENYIRFYESGVLETASVYQYAYQYGRANATQGEVRSTAQNKLFCSSGLGTAGNETGSGYHYFYNLGNSSKYSFVTTHWYNIEASGVPVYVFGGGVLPQASLVNGIRIYPNSGTVSGTVKLYGVKQL